MKRKKCRAFFVYVLQLNSYWHKAFAKSLDRVARNHYLDKMKLEKILAILMISSVLGAFSSCKEEEESVPFKVAFPPHYTVKMEGETKQIVARSNYEVVATFEDCKEWVELESSCVKEGVRHCFNFKFAANKTPDERIGQIIFASNDLLDTITITQSGVATVYNLEKEYKVAAKASAFTIPLKHNFEEAGLVVNDTAWISAKIVGDSVIQLNIKENVIDGDKGKLSRKGTVTINRIADGKVIGKVTDIVVNQTVKDAIIVNKTYKIGSTNPIASVLYESNYLATIEIGTSYSWLKVKQGDGGYEYKRESDEFGNKLKEPIIVFTYNNDSISHDVIAKYQIELEVEENTTGEDRFAEVKLVHPKNKELIEVFTLFQAKESEQVSSTSK